MGSGVESRFERYSDVMVQALEHADRATPARWYLRGLMLPGESQECGADGSARPSAGCVLGASIDASLGGRF